MYRSGAPSQWTPGSTAAIRTFPARAFSRGPARASGANPEQQDAGRVHQRHERRVPRVPRGPVARGSGLGPGVLGQPPEADGCVTRASHGDRCPIRVVEPALADPRARRERPRPRATAPQIFSLTTAPDASPRLIFCPTPRLTEASPFTLPDDRFRRDRLGTERDVRRREDRRGARGPLRFQRAVQPEHPGVHAAPAPRQGVPGERALHGQPRSARPRG